jgi:transposase InsO family protein
MVETSVLKSRHRMPEKTVLNRCHRTILVTFQNVRITLDTLCLGVIPMPRWKAWSRAMEAINIWLRDHKTQSTRRHPSGGFRQVEVVRMVSGFGTLG